MKNTKYYSLPIIALSLLFGCQKVDHEIVGKWQTVGPLSDSLFFDEVACELTFKENGRFEKFSDGGMSIQTRQTGKYQIDGDNVIFDFSDHREPWAISFKIADSRLSLSDGGQSLDFVRSDQTSEALLALPEMPSTLKEATDLLISEMSEDDKTFVATRAQDDLIMFHMGWGMGIRNRFGLWAGNKKLLSSCGSRWMHPDSASGVIINSVWKELRNDLDPSYLKDIEEIQALAKTIPVHGPDIAGKTFKEIADFLAQTASDSFLVTFDIHQREGHDTHVIFETFEGEQTLAEILSMLSFRFGFRLLYEPGKIVVSE
ncbi:lipocalin family protein [Pelagicoccus mobilis]|uniref:Uncharacterized protein n=1 Tax=Pelagicoccus mobilis TaxID=415221 RepID=A0A934VTE4_9BACT|nr:lipocalin family protein [Pelagicoccus mobilis]MBK1879623.1 hypothetical protein [Pelagicoccus mobilis]